MMCRKPFFAFILICLSGLTLTMGDGNDQKKTRIVGGAPISISSAPYVASLQYIFYGGVHHICGSSIISSSYLLTSAICNPGLLISLFYARVGSTSMASGGQSIKVSTFLVHPMYNNVNKNYDAAVAGLQSSIVFGANAMPINLAPLGAADPLPGSSMFVAGWGKTSEFALLMSLNLNAIYLPMVNPNTCQFIYPQITNSQMCIGGLPSGGKGACLGDVGTPAVFDGKLYGIGSGGWSCQLPNIPQFFTKVSVLADWVKQFL